MSTHSHAVDPLDGLVDFSQYDDAFQSSPSLSPATTSKSRLAGQPLSAAVTPHLPTAWSSPSGASGPSHQYDLYKQQTPFVPGAIASTMAVNQSLDGFLMPSGVAGLGYGIGDEFLDFSAEMDFVTTPADHFLPTDSTSPADHIQMSPMFTSPAPPSNVGRLWPGAHSHAANLAKNQAQKQQRQQQQQQQQTQQPRPQQQPQQPLPQLVAKPKANKQSAAVDPIVEQKITQLLSSMRSKPAMDDGSAPTPMAHLQRLRKDQEDMDEDERLLASEEGKRLTSKERRQLRNKVSARAFRSRRKEYISQLEAEITNKVNENGELRGQNRALMDENKRLNDLTRVLLSSSAFSSFLDTLTSDVSSDQAASSGADLDSTSSQPPIKMEQKPQPHAHKDVNPYALAQPQHGDRLGVDMASESTGEYPIMTIDPSTFSYRPQVYTVLSLPDVPLELETSIMSGKAPSFLDSLAPPKAELAVIDRLSEPGEENNKVAPPCPSDSQFESDPSFALYHHDATLSATLGAPSPVECDVGNHGDANGSDSDAVDAAMERVNRISENLGPVIRRIEWLMRD